MIIAAIDENGVAYPLKIDANRNLAVSLNAFDTVLPVSIDGINVNLPVESYPHLVYSMLNATQVLKFGEAQNTTTTLYTVPTGKTLYVTSIFAHISNSSATGNVVDVSIYNASSVEQMRWRLAAVAGALNIMAVPFAVPIMLSVGWSVRLYSPANLVYIRGSFAGYEL